MCNWRGCLPRRSSWGRLGGFQPAYRGGSRTTEDTWAVKASSLIRLVSVNEAVNAQWKVMIRQEQVSQRPPAAATGAAVLHHAPLSKLTEQRVACLSHSRGLPGMLPVWIEYQRRCPHASAKLFHYILLNKVQSRGVVRDILISAACHSLMCCTWCWKSIH